MKKLIYKIINKYFYFVFDMNADETMEAINLKHWYKARRMGYKKKDMHWYYAEQN